MKTKAEIQAEITALVVEQLEKGIVPWRKPFNSAGVLPTSLVTGKTYGGINLLLLSMLGAEYSSPYWLTYREAEKRGGNIKRGEKGFPVIKWSIYDRKNSETGETAKAFFLKQFVVFNIEQAENVSAPEMVKREPISIPEGVDNILNSYVNKPSIFRTTREGAYYSPVLDTIHLPLDEQFVSGAEYAHTLAHELVHSTGHESRLNRFNETGKPEHFGSENYAKEELVADIGAQMVCAQAGIDIDLPNTASYVAGWLKALNNDTSLILSASTKAQKACEYMLANVREEVSA